MSQRFKFVNGDGGPSHESALEAASKDGYAIKFVASDPSPGAISSNKPVIVLMEKK